MKQKRKQNKIPIWFGICDDKIEIQLNKFGFTLNDKADYFEEKREKIHESYLNEKITDKKKNKLYMNLYDSVINNMVKVGDLR